LPAIGCAAVVDADASKPLTNGDRRDCWCFAPDRKQAHSCNALLIDPRWNMATIIGKGEAGLQNFNGTRAELAFKVPLLWRSTAFGLYAQ
jgi:hypothetical protein